MPPPHELQALSFTHPGRVSLTVPRRPRSSHPLHASHTPSTCFRGSQHAHPSHDPSAPCRCAQPGVPFLFSSSKLLFQYPSCAPRAPNTLPCRAVITMETRCASRTILSTGSVSFESSFWQVTPSFVMAAKDLVSHGCPRLPTKTGSIIWALLTGRLPSPCVSSALCVSLPPGRASCPSSHIAPCPVCPYYGAFRLCQSHSLLEYTHGRDLTRALIRSSSLSSRVACR